MTSFRPKTFACCGGAFGDEGKGRIVDMLVHQLSQKGEVIVYRDNGGANAGHTVEFADGHRIALHQLPSGAFIKGAVIVLGKEMVLHPGDLLEELVNIKAVKSTKDRAKVKIDRYALLSLDTHRAYENVLKQWQTGGKGATGRGISPAYSDVLLRHPLRMKDIVVFNDQKIKQHYQMYSALIKGLGHDMSSVLVPSLNGATLAVGSEAEFLRRLKAQGLKLAAVTYDLHDWLSEKWQDKKCGFVFEKSQAIGLDYRWGVYPDITASDTTFDGIFSATEGVIDPDKIKFKAGVIKATYMSSVGVRQLPSIMTGELADRIREDAHEYGATTKRPRDIAYLDIPALKFFCKVGRLNSLVLTHMDISYSDFPIKICTGYTVAGKNVEYRPDQEFLNTVAPTYIEMPSWDASKLAAARNLKELPAAARKFLKFMSQSIGVPISIITTGPKRDQTILLQFKL